jgi:MFS transporter, DHA2 family, multidrug resistance protein
MVIGFAIASLLCGAVASLPEIVVFRLFQGVFGTGLVPLSQAVLLDTYPPEQHGSAMAMWGVGVIVSPILGPTLGGYLTEFYNWRWVFYINLPFGILAIVGMMAFVPKRLRDRNRTFDMFGFALLSLSIGAMQMMLDRGESQDWLSSSEIIIGATLAGLFLYMFLVHMFTARNPFLEPGLFKDRNLVVGLALIFVVGIILLATLALLPPFLQGLMGFPVLTTGYVFAPRGVGTMIAMILVGRVICKVDMRLLIFAGISLTALSLWEMSGFTKEVPIATIVKTGLVQGLGLGFIFVPLSTLTFSTLAPRYRNEGTAMFSLMRNIGSSIGISIVMTLLAQNTQSNHSSIADLLTPFRQVLQAPWLPQAWNWHTQTGVASLNAEVTRQAATIAYMTDF